MWNQELDSMIIVFPFQLRILYESQNLYMLIIVLYK